MKAAPSHPTTTPLSRLRQAPFIILTTFVILLLWYWYDAVRERQRDIEQDFTASVSHAVGLLNERFSFYQNIAFATKGLFNSSEEVTEQEWHHFIRALQVTGNYPGVQSIAFAQYREYGENYMLTDRLHEVGAVELANMPPEQRGFSVVISHLEPYEERSGMLGYDLAGEPATLLALRDACRRGEAMLTKTIEMPQQGVTIVRQVMPVFARSMAVATEAERHESLLGWISVTYDVQAWLDHFSYELHEGNVYFTIAGVGDKVFYDTRPEGAAPAYRETLQLNLGGALWELNFYSTEGFERRHADPMVHLFPLGGLLLTLLLWLAIRWLQGGKLRAEALASTISDRLRESEARYREMFEGNKAVELLIDPADGAIVDANQAAVNYYGYTRDELKRKHISDINTLSADEIAEEMRRAAEQRRNHFLFKHRHATGEVRDVEVHSGPIEVGGKQLLYSIVHDVTARMESEKALRESEERYHTIIDTTAEGYWLVDLESLRILDANDALCRMLGYSREELVERTPFELADEENARVFAYQATQIKTTQQRSYEVVLRHKEGHEVIVRINATNMPHGGKEPVQAFAFITDITEWKRTEEQLRIAATFFDTTSEAITVTDANNRIIAVNPAFTLITGYSEAETLGRDPSFLSSGRNNEAFYRNMWHTLERMGRWQGEIWNRRKNGEIYPEWLSIVAIKDTKGVTKQYMAVFSDITKRKRDEEKIWRQANYDGLTGLPNRNLFKDRLDQAMHAAHREGTMLALMFIDLDRFKWVNDTLGHASGDLLLQQTASRLKQCVRETDTVARLGGDEFTVLLNDISHTGDVDRVAEMLLARLAEPYDLEGKEAFVSGSIGITLYPGDAEDMEQLLGNADAAMYTAKTAGRNVFRYFTQEMNLAAQRRLRLETDLRRVLERDELELHYQPIVSGEGKVAGAEALLRWNHPELGAISPDEFIPLAEETGSIVPIEQWVMRKACHDTVGFQALRDEAFFISVNVSSVQCSSDRCQQVLAEALAVSGLEAGNLKLEITERVMMDNTEQVIGLLQGLREMGIGLSVDDFGTGYSSLSYLKQFPVDVLKIDRAFVDGLPDDKDDVALVEAIVAMAHSLNLQVVGEGVETEEQLVFLRSLGCDLIQGYLYSHPLPAARFIDYLKQH